MDWFLYDNGLRHEKGSIVDDRVGTKYTSENISSTVSLQFSQKLL